MSSASRLRGLSILLATVIALANARTTLAGCTTTTDASTVRKSIGQVVRCNNKKFSNPAAVCTITPAPACAETLITDSIALGYGPNNPSTVPVDTRALKAQLNCQKAIGRAVKSYVGSKLKDLIAGKPLADAEARATKALNKLPEKCPVTVAQDLSGVVLPAVGPQCAAAVGGPGTPVDPASLRDCLHTLLQVWVDRFGPSPQPLRPNIVLILTDDQRWDTIDATHSPLGAFIMPRVKAELMDSGVTFPNGFMTTPLCCPSRSALLRGQYAHRTGVYKNCGTNGGADDFDDSVSMGTILQDAIYPPIGGTGYHTGFVGKYLNGYSNLWTSPNPPYVPPGWSEWYGMKNVAFFDYTIVENGVEVAYGSAEADYSTDVLREKARAFIANAATLGKPFFLYFAPKAPHLPEIPAPRHDGMFSLLPAWRPPSYNEPDVSDKPTWMQNTPQLTPTQQANLDVTRIHQLEMLQAVDEAIGGNPTYAIEGIMDALRDAGVDDDTIVIFMSDNGWHWGEHRTQAKNKPYEESIRTPFVIRYPTLAPLTRVETQTALNIDLCATLTELAGSTPPILQDGTSLLRLIDGTAPTWRTDFLTEGWPNNRVWATVREDETGGQQWKYTEIPVDETNPATTFEYELYDLVSDPYELDNVAGNPAHAQRLLDMGLRLRQLRPNWPVDANPNGPDPEE